MTGSKNRTQSKCRMWEKERRNKLSIAFVDLAQCLPSTPATTTKILILQRAVKYIKELQKKNEDLQASEKKHPGNITALLEKLSVLEERCSQLIQHMQQNGLSVASPLLLTPKESNISIDIECGNEIEEGNKNTESNDKLNDIIEIAADNIKEKVEENIQHSISDTSNKEDKTKDDKINLSKITKKTSRKVHLTKKKNSKRKMKGEHITNISYPSKLTQKNNTINNVWFTNSNQNGAMMLGNTLLPLIPKAPLLLSSPQQTPAIFLLQRPLITNYPNKKDSNTNSLPVIMPVNSPDKQFQRLYSNVYGLDVTKTTMVNKVPIPAFSSSSSITKGKTLSKNSCSLRVSHKNRRKFLNSIKTAKKNESKASSSNSENDKENISKDIKLDNVIRDSVIIANKDNDVGKNTDVIPPLIDKNESNDISMTDSNKSEVQNDALQAIELTPTNKSADEAKADINIQRDETRDFTSGKSELESHVNINEKKSDVSQQQDKVCLPEEKSIQPKNDYELSSCKTNEQSSSDCRMHINKTNNMINNSDIPDDLLASFVAPQEQTIPSSPLASSPLATSPTAAFLLAFPLVCPGPRPDTPLNDNLQTPNLCSLDNFSTFFTSKDTAIGNAHTLFTDCQSKQPTTIILSGKPKQSWTNTFPKNVESEMTLKNDSCSRISTINKDTDIKPITTSSTCAYSNTQAIFQNSKIPNADSQYYLGESLFNYETLTSMSNQKDPITNSKDDNLSSKQYNFGNTPQNIVKNKSADVTTCTSTVSNYTQNVLTSTACTSNRSYNYNASSNTDNCKRNQGNDSCMKLVLPGVIPEFSSTSKNIDIPFTFQNQSKAVFPNSSNIYTSCNTYNPFSSDFSSNSMNLSLSCGNSLNSIRTKASTTYFPEFNSSNIYSQNCNIWSEDTQIDYDPGKIDYNRKLNLPIPFNQNQTHNIVPDFQSDIRFSLPVISKCSNTKQNSVVDSKNSKVNKCSAKDSKYVESKNKTDYMNQKGPVNWMTSDVTHNDAFFSNYKEIKSEQNLMLSNTNQSCVDAGSNISSIGSLNCKKTDFFEQPFFPIPPSSYMSQVVTEENQFTWSPSKLTTFGDNTALAPCSLPTLVGDLALGIISEPKIVYQPFNQEQESSSKDRKTNTQKNLNNKNNCSQNAEGNVSQNFFSVSQLVERGKMPDSVNDHSKTCVTNNHKNVIASDEVKNFNANKIYDTSINVSVFPPEHYLIQPPLNNQHAPKDTNFNKIDNNKNANKNNYSTEALLQNNTQYHNSRKQKQSIQKLYGDGSYPIHGNQFISSNHPLQFDNFGQNQQYSNTTFPYSATTVTMNSSFYSSPNFITSTNTMGTSNYINSSFPSDINEFQNTDNLFYPPKTENVKLKQQNDTLPDFTKYSLNKPTMMSKESSKIKPEVCVKKDTTPPNKRQKKQKSYSNNYSDRCYGTIQNQTNSPKPIDESFYGYTSSQMHPYPAQPNLLPTIQHSQKSNFSAKPNINVMSSSPNPVGTSLTNFNLSTIFPEINKRSTMPGFNETQHLSTHLSKVPSSGVFH